MITPINIALLGVVLAAVALVILRRRRSGATDEAAFDEVSDETLATVDEPATVDEDEVPDVFSNHIWAEAAATVAPVREDETDTETEAEAEALDAADDGDDLDAQDDGDDLDAQDDESDEQTGEIEGLQVEAAIDFDDGLGEIITEPGWYLPGETDMTRGSPGAQPGLLVADSDLMLSDEDLMLSGVELEDELGAATTAPSAPLLGEDVDGFDAAAGWAAPVEVGTQPAGPSWLGLAEDDETPADADEISLEVAASPPDDLFGLPPLAEGGPEDEHDLGASSFPLDQWQGPATTPAPFPTLGDASAERTVSQHGPLTISIDPAALLAIETEGIERSSPRGDGDVSWELTLKVELRQRSDTPDGGTD